MIEDSTYILTEYAVKEISNPSLEGFDEIKNPETGKVMWIQKKVITPLPFIDSNGPADADE